MTIRELRQEDIPACAGILQSVYNNELWQCRWTQTAAEAYLDDIFAMRRFVGYAAEEGGRIVGAIFAREKVWWNNSEVYVEEMFVIPEEQGKGHGSRLLDAVEQYVAAHGLAGITLSTNRYAPAPGFYARHGFKECGHVMFMARERL